MNRALIIEDDTSIRSLVSIVLGKEDYSVEIAGDGVEGLKKLKERTYDLVLLDMMMPRMNGADVVKVLAQQDPSVLAHVVLMTAASPLQLDYSLKRVYGILHKPFDIDQLKEYADHFKHN